MDNAGFVYVFAGISSLCPYSYTIVKALFDVGCGLACRIIVEQTPR